MMEEDCSISTNVLHYGYNIEDCLYQHGLWKISVRIRLEELECKKISTKWTYNLYKWDRHEHGVDELTCAKEFITCLDTTIGKR